MSAFETVKDPSSKYSQQSGDEGMTLSSSNSFLNGEIGKTETPNVKKRHRRVKSSGVKNSEYDGEFMYLIFPGVCVIKCKSKTNN